MAFASGLSQTLAIAEETTYGTAPSLASARGFYVNSDSLTWGKTVVQGEGMRGNSQVALAARRVLMSKAGSGDVEMDFATKGMGLWLKHAMGSSSIVQIGATPAFKQTHTLASTLGKSLTIQRGLPLADASLQPFTMVGSKITGFSIGADHLDICKLKVTIDGRDDGVGTSYSAPSFTLADAASVFSFAGSALYVAGSGTPVASNMQFGFEVKHSMKTDRFHTGAAGLKAEPLNNGLTEAVVTVDSEYADQVTWVARNYTDETFALVQYYEGAVISGSEKFYLRITTPAVKIDGANPTGDGRDVLSHTLTCPVLFNGTDAPVTIEYCSTDTAV